MSGCRISKVKFKDGGELVIMRENSVSPAVQYLRDRLADMVAGDVFGVATVVLHEDGSVGTGWDEGFANNVFQALGGIENLKNRFWREGMGNE